MFGDFIQDDWVQLGVVVLLAALPALIWSYLIFKGRKTSRWPLLLAFFLGTLTVIPLILIYDYLWVRFPILNVYNAIESNITDMHYAAILSLIVVGILEELAKSGVVRTISKTRIGIQTINDAVKYSILAGLGFAFTENIVYFRDAWMQGGVAGLLPVMVFRSLFTVCGHMVFSGIYGYFYGIAKFAHPIMETKLWMGERSFGVRVLSKILGTNEAKAFSQLMLLKGLFIAMMIHAAFNSFLEFNYFFPVVILVGLGLLYLLYLLAHKAGAIVFASSGRSSSMARRDVDTVLELLGMWSQEGRHKDVIDICQRLLLRDPDNKVVQLFQAKAMDSQKLTDLETSFTSLFQAEDKAVTDPSLRTLVKQKVLMEMLKEKQIAAPAPAALPAPLYSGPKVPQIPGLGVPQNGPSSPPNNP
ncbi:MAG: PrsW family intramembrane metalloprotease [Candidatus Gracilibacteria bacterium]